MFLLCSESMACTSRSVPLLVKSGSEKKPEKLRNLKQKEKELERSS